MKSGRRMSDGSIVAAWFAPSGRLFWPLVLVGAFLAGLLFWNFGRGEAQYDGAPSWSPDGGTMAFSAEQQGATNIFVMNASGTDRRQLTDEAAESGAPAFSPDGTQIAFESNRSGNFDIYVMDADGSDVRRLTTEPSEDRAPSWSHDGLHLAFLSDRAGGPPQVFTMSADGSDVRQVTFEGQHWAPQFAPGDGRIAVQVDRDIYIVDEAGSPPRRLTYDPRNGMSPFWSPDGQQIVFASTRNARLELFTMYADGSDQRLLVSMPTGSAIDPRWSPDGTRVAFVYVPSDSASGAVQPYGISILDLASDRVTRLSP